MVILTAGRFAGQFGKIVGAESTGARIELRGSSGTIVVTNDWTSAIFAPALPVDLIAREFTWPIWREPKAAPSELPAGTIAKLKAELKFNKAPPVPPIRYTIGKVKPHYVACNGYESARYLRGYSFEVLNNGKPTGVKVYHAIRSLKVKVKYKNDITEYNKPKQLKADIKSAFGRFVYGALVELDASLSSVGIKIGR